MVKKQQPKTGITAVMATINTSGPYRDLAIMMLELAVAKQHRTKVETQDQTVKESR